MIYLRLRHKRCVRRLVNYLTHEIKFELTQMLRHDSFAIRLAASCEAN